MRRPVRKIAKRHQGQNIILCQNIMFQNIIFVRKAYDVIKRLSTDPVVSVLCVLLLLQWCTRIVM